MDLPAKEAEIPDLVDVSWPGPAFSSPEGDWGFAKVNPGMDFGSSRDAQYLTSSPSNGCSNFADKTQPSDADLTADYCCWRSSTWPDMTLDRHRTPRDRTR